MSVPGGIKPSQPINEEVAQIAKGAKSAIEEKAGRTFSTFNPVSFATQLVAGTNYFIKIDVGGEFIHARVYKDLKSNISVHSVQHGKSESDPITYF